RLQELNDTIEAQKRIAALSETSAEAAVLRTKSALDFAKKRLNWTTVTASMSGTVTNLDIEAGEIITSGRSAFSSGPPIMTIADLSKMIVRVPINEVDMGQIRIGQRAEITVSAFPGKKFPGLIYQIAPSGLVSENVVRFQVEIEVVGSPPELLPGMTADVDIFVVDRPDALQAPIEAVLEDDAVGIFVAVPDTEMAQLNQGETVKVETRLGKQVNARLSSVSNPVRLTLLDDTKSWRPGPVEFSIVTSAGGRIASLSGNVTQTKSYYVEVPDGEPTPEGPPKANKVTVDVGVKNEGFYEVLSGVSPGTKVLVRPPRADANPFGRPGGR
ncbi:MAG: HlyD family efflux transporter periplasmic adaptor subunit, partial [Candidatus Poribacteria bacterium]|nr:HlyD family efflux transporter periplasmic adaptor subunit [Candidatus Poribacteria bacterium]